MTGKKASLDSDRTRLASGGGFCYNIWYLNPLAYRTQIQYPVT